MKDTPPLLDYASAFEILWSLLRRLAPAASGGSGCVFVKVGRFGASSRGAGLRRGKIRGIFTTINIFVSCGAMEAVI